MCGIGSKNGRNLLALVSMASLVVTPVLSIAGEASEVTSITSPPVDTGSAADVDASENGEERSMNLALVAGMGTIGLGVVAAGVGGAMHIANRDNQASPFLYIGGGFLGLMGLYIFATGLAGHPHAQSLPQQAVLPYFSSDGGGVAFTRRF